ncbi:MAG: D-alanyl-D-alanine carboxypeptidase [Spirochaetales bacterium]|nr:D-alanyl-D-alanine carboxypeptidase [Spirochaetales bacterium]
MRKITTLFTAILISAAAFGQSAPPPPEINAASAILIESGTGAVLYEKNADSLIPPASMTKLMTIHVALNSIKAGVVTAASLVPVSEAADFRSLPPRSSLMFLEKGQKVSLTELLKGLALPSGNDAGIAVAEFIAGSVSEYVALMNLEAERLGLVNTHFDDASGLSEKNMTTAREFASFCAFYLNKHPEASTELHMLTTFTYPEDHNLPEGGVSVHGPIKQPNHNLLIGRMKNVDGLKTGYIDESGFNLAASAEFEGRRFILVTMGGPGRSSRDGSIRRAIDGAALFNYGFYGWTTFTPEVPENQQLRIWGGEKNMLNLRYSPANTLTVPAPDTGFLELTSEYIDIDYPVKKDSIVGSWKLADRNGSILQSGTINAAEDVQEGNIFKRIIDRIRQ